jgi:hypothetical protein
MWLDVSAARGIRIAAANRDQVARHMTPDQIVAAQELACGWKTAKQWLAAEASP